MGTAFPLLKLCKNAQGSNAAAKGQIFVPSSTLSFLHFVLLQMLHASYGQSESAARSVTFAIDGFIFRQNA